MLIQFISPEKAEVSTPPIVRVPPGAVGAEAVVKVWVLRFRKEIVSFVDSGGRENNGNSLELETEDVLREFPCLGECLNKGSST